MSKAQFNEAQAAKDFILAGRSRFTLVSKSTGQRYTYRVAKKAKADIWFVSVLTGGDNTGDYTFLGTIFDSGKFFHGKKSAIGYGAGSAKAFRWCWERIAALHMPSTVEVWHEGACGRCARPLTVPESIETGLGPICMAKAA